MEKIAIIRKEGDNYFVYSHKGKRLGGPYKSEGQAKHRLQQIEYFKKQGAWSTGLKDRPLTGAMGKGKRQSMFGEGNMTVKLAGVGDILRAAGKKLETFGKTYSGKALMEADDAAWDAAAKMEERKYVLGGGNSKVYLERNKTNIRKSFDKWRNEFVQRLKKTVAEREAHQKLRKQVKDIAAVAGIAYGIKKMKDNHMNKKAMQEFKDEVTKLSGWGTSAMEFALKHPVGTTAAVGAVGGAAVGATANKENRLGGAISGGMLGAGIGALAGKGSAMLGASGSVGKSMGAVEQAATNVAKATPAAAAKPSILASMGSGSSVAKATSAAEAIPPSPGKSMSDWARTGKSYVRTQMSTMFPTAATGEHVQFEHGLAKGDALIANSKKNSLLKAQLVAKQTGVPMPTQAPEMNDLKRRLLRTRGLREGGVENAYSFNTGDFGSFVKNNSYNPRKKWLEL